MKFEPDRVNASFIIRRAIQMQAGMAIGKNISLLFDESNNYYVHADEGLLLQAFNNLLSNSIKFTPPGGIISVHVNPQIEKREIRFSVKDNGTGIREEDIPKLFKVDSKFTTTGTKGEKGTGLGLSLVSDIVAKHGGEIGVKSTYGLGAEFFFTIPVSSTNILLVDDMKTDRMLYAKLFKSLIPGYTVTEAGNGKEALDLIKQSSPALVISDHRMPVMGGYELVKQITMSDLKMKPSVIILSSDINDVVEEEYRDLGVEYIFQKPVNLNAFKQAVEKCLRKITTG
jgi:CheY-like chemotaxis protein